MAHSITFETSHRAGNNLPALQILQNNGHGTSMIQATEAMTFRRWRVVAFHMTVITLREELIAFYERLGYVRSGEFKNFPENSALWQSKVTGLTLEYLVKIVKR